MEIGPELVQRAQSGDRDGLRELVETAYPTVHRWALVRTGDAMEADDLTQDVMIQMIRKIRRYRGTARFSTWLYTVTRNAAADGFRRAKRQAAVADDPRAVEAFTPTAPVGADEQMDRGTISGVVGAFFKELPLRQREVFDLVELQGLAAPEVAERLGIEPVSVRAHLFKARKALRIRILEAHPELTEDFR